MGEPNEHIAAWEAAGLIDAATAERLRVAAAASDSVPAAPGAVVAPPAAPPDEAPSQAAAMFGPSITIPEVFGYLGTAFLLAGWTTFLFRQPFETEGSSLGAGIGALIAAAALVGLGLILRRGDERRRRSAGVAFLVAVPYVGGGVAALAGAAGLDGPQAGVVGAGAALVVAIGLRGIHPAVLTQVGLLGAITGAAAAILFWFESVRGPSGRFSDDGSFIPGGPDPVILLVATAIWWLACALLIGLIGLLEARAADSGDAAAGRRAAISRFWAGIVAVAGLATAVTRSAYDTTGLDYRRVLEPWMGQLAMVVLSLILLERAFRRDATAYVYAAALGLIVALSDFNFTYLTDSTEIGLVIEGAILLAVGLAADRLRRQVGRRDNLAHPEATITDLERTAAEMEPSSSDAPEAPAAAPSAAAVPTPPAATSLSSSEPKGDDPPTQPPDRPQSGARR
jgi:hypothetical protein